MTFAATRIGMPLADFIEAFEQQPFEIINGERRPKLPNVFGHSETSQTLFLALHLYVAANQAGSAVIETTFILPNGDDPDWVLGSRIPDVMFFAGDRLAQYKAHTPDYRSRPIALRARSSGRGDFPWRQVQRSR